MGNRDRPLPTNQHHPHPNRPTRPNLPTRIATTANQPRLAVTTETDAIDPDDEPEELILESLHRSLQQVRDGKVHLISKLWDGIEV